MAEIGTPMKLTRSFPAKAMAKEKVPARTTIFRGLTLYSRCRRKQLDVANTKTTATIHRLCSKIQVIVSELNKVVPFIPLISKKYTMQAIPAPENKGPSRARRFSY